MTEEHMTEERKIHPCSIERIKSRMQAHLQPEVLEIIDESPNHANHYHNKNKYDDEDNLDEKGEYIPTHIRIDIKCSKFDSISPIEAHRMIYEQLKDELSKGLHAISINIKKT